eukprot:CAMPEP_0194270926 /NCGR_PEP_ID=MMETSP0169-20130528/4824_1 /TAXON_ID=218684 /ORGANISM="Corethron pennatum, Strain L29A3" /LENGTH=655 /DNA_ID=CAMNT_0039013143 /DNA_START=81 /DNA_END=2048 /DNA_ORIENTATION=+
MSHHYAPEGSGGRSGVSRRPQPQPHVVGGGGGRRKGITIEDLKRQTAVRLAQEHHRKHVADVGRSAQWDFRADPHEDPPPPPSPPPADKAPLWQHPYSPAPLAGGSSFEGPSPHWSPDAAEDSASDASSASYLDEFVAMSAGSGRTAQVVGQRNRVNSDGVVSYGQGAGGGSVRAYHRHHHISYARSVDYQHHTHHNHRTLPVVTPTYTKPFADSSSSTAFKKKLAHGLTVHELKEMTRARLAREAEHDDPTPEPEDSPDALAPTSSTAPFHTDALSGSNCENVDAQFSFPPSTHRRHHPSHEMSHQQRPGTLRSQDTNKAVSARPLSSKFFVQEERLSKDDANSLLPFDHPQTTNRYSPPPPPLDPQPPLTKEASPSAHSYGPIADEAETPLPPQGPLELMKSFMPSLFDYSFRAKVHPMGAPPLKGSSPPGLSLPAKTETDPSSFFLGAGTTSQAPPPERYSLYDGFGDARAPLSAPPRPADRPQAPLEPTVSFFHQPPGFHDAAADAPRPADRHHRKNSSELPKWVAESVLAHFQEQDPAEDAAARRRQVFRKSSLNMDYADEIPGEAIRAEAPMPSFSYSFGREADGDRGEFGREEFDLMAIARTASYPERGTPDFVGTMLRDCYQPEEAPDFGPVREQKKTTKKTRIVSA